MKNTTENLKPEHIYLNLANCSEEERKEVIAMLPEEKVKGDYRTDYYYNYLVYFSKAEKWFVNFNVESKTEVNFQEFKEIMGATFEDEKVEIFDIDFGGNCMARMEIKNGKFKFTDAMNGGGYSIAIEDIKITPTN